MGSCGGGAPQEGTGGGDKGVALRPVGHEPAACRTRCASRNRSSFHVANDRQPAADKSRSQSGDGHVIRETPRHPSQHVPPGGHRACGPASARLVSVPTVGHRDRQGDDDTRLRLCATRTEHGSTGCRGGFFTREATAQRASSERRAPRVANQGLRGGSGPAQVIASGRAALRRGQAECDPRRRACNPGRPAAADLLVADANVPADVAHPVERIDLGVQRPPPAAAARR